ncbi:hypothetical protein [sulfur-oxidizing endosymbiont of Gigantopelta aegis]|uniref:hypothetical protein n=1 Tax=sulfur-oxidizing endosymbiont of Gigantopelta aegis TaxID=2794934 RepID=UPI0018DC02AD|nr:hypothetical protein [sulfur-oxidizing endosymbiont of Gigantopelta aegis]
MNFDVRKRIIFPVILLLISTIIALSIAEMTLRILNIGYGNAPQEPHPVFHHVHPREYRFVSHDPAGEYGGHKIYYDNERLVNNPESIKQVTSNCLITFLGDSFTEAGQVPDVSFTAQAEEPMAVNGNGRHLCRLLPLFNQSI